MKTFYKIENGKAQVGSGTFVPPEFIVYIVGQEPNELLEALAIDTEEQRIQSIKQKAGELIVASGYSIIWQLNHTRGNEAYVLDYAYIDSIRDISNKAEQDGTKAEDVQWQ